MPLKRRLSDEVRKYVLDRIANGEYARGERVETIRELCMRLKVSHMVAAAAMRSLAEEKVVISHVGRGTIVSPDLPDTYFRKTPEMVSERKILYFFFETTYTPRLSSYHAEVLSHLQSAAALRGWETRVELLAGERLLHAARSSGTVGIVSCCVDQPFPELPVPVVCYGIAARSFQNCCVVADNFRAGVEGTRRLLNRGCRRLVFIDGRDKPREGAWDGWNPELQFAETFHGMESVCRERGLSPELASWNINSDCEEMDRILRQLPGTTGTGFLIGNRSMAWEIVLRARELGIRIPEELSIVTFVSRGGREMELPLDTFNFDSRTVAEQCVICIENARRGGVLPSRILTEMPFHEEGSS